MSDVIKSDALTTDQIDGRILSALETRPCPTAEILGLLTILHDCGQFQRLSECLLVIQANFTDNAAFDDILRLYALRATWGAPNDAELWKEFKEAAEITLKKDRLGEAIYRSVIEPPVPALGEAIRRMIVLRSCKTGKSCFDRTWGFGTIKRLDDFYKRIMIDFDRKPNHTLSFQYAGEVLELLDENHILAVRHNTKDEFFSLLKDNPAEIARMALRCFGPMSVERMDELFDMYSLLPPGMEWKTFWTKARAGLKKDKLVFIPPATKKTELIRILDHAVSVGDADWFSSMSGCNDVAELMTMLSAVTPKMISEVGESAASTVSNRLAFVVRAAETAHDSTTLVRVIIIASSLAVPGVPVEEWVAKIADADFVTVAGPKLATRDIDRMTALIGVGKVLETSEPFIKKIPQMCYSLLEFIMPLLMNGPCESATAEQLVMVLSRPAPSPAVVFWLAKNQDKANVRALFSPGIIATNCLEFLDGAETGERLRIQHLVAKRFLDFTWLSELTSRMTDVELQATYERIRASEDSWEPAERRSIIGALVTKYPELGATSVESKTEEPAEAKRITSWRSIKLRKEQHHKLVSQDIPQNAKDIEVARGYGDLRENFEYQTAKDQQRILLQRQEEMAKELREIEGTDFTDFPCDKAGVGTAVSVAYAGGTKAIFYILGEWDSDEATGIVPSGSGVAKQLNGCKPGDNVKMPGGVDAVVESVSALPAEILSWAAGN